ncbi:unnamed protein product [Effrenium voratum]|nr:unnamed protein product [Effrenium voratum]
MKDHRLSGMLSADASANPVFHNWTLVYVPYCDGASFTGDSEVDGLHFKGQQILNAVITELETKERLLEARKVVLSGGSAGASAVLFHADALRERLQGVCVATERRRMTENCRQDMEVLALADAGFFLDLPDIKGIRCWPNQIISLFNVSRGYSGLHSDCLERFKSEPWRCLFPQYYADLISTRTYPGTFRRLFSCLPEEEKQAGVVTGDLAWALLQHAKELKQVEHKYAIPAFNCTSTSTINSVLEAGKELNRPIIIQFSEGGAAFMAGKSLPNEKGKLQASILGAVAGAHFARAVAPAYGIPVLVHSDHCAKKLLPWFDGMLEADEAFFKQHGEPLFSSHMLDLSEEVDEENIEICAKYLKRMAPMKIILEMEIGITGGVEDGVDNSGASKDKLYSTPEDVFAVYEGLSPISPMFTIAAAFGNCHGVYKVGNVKLKPEILMDMQKHAQEKIKASTGKDIERPLNFVFHGGSGSEKHHITTALSAGVVKMNVDTDTQWAYWEGLLKFYKAKEGYLQAQIGNPEGEDKPNKSYYDPRKWIRESELTMVKRAKEACADLANVTFLANSLYDSSELQYTLRLDCSPDGRYQRSCDAQEMARFEELRSAHAAAWRPLAKRPGNGLWAVACVDHTLTWGRWTDPHWQVPEDGAGLAEAVQQWLGGQSVHFEDSVPWPMNRPCSGAEGTGARRSLTGRPSPELPAPQAASYDPTHLLLGAGAAACGLGVLCLLQRRKPSARSPDGLEMEIR